MTRSWSKLVDFLQEFVNIEFFFFRISLGVDVTNVLGGRLFLVDIKFVLPGTYFILNYQRLVEKVFPVSTRLQIICLILFTLHNLY